MLFFEEYSEVLSREKFKANTNFKIDAKLLE